MLFLLNSAISIIIVTTPLTLTASCYAEQSSTIWTSSTTCAECPTINTWTTTTTKCQSKTNENLSVCPKNFILKNDLCYTVIKTTFPPKCPFNDTAPYEKYKALMQDIDDKIWMPVTRNLKYGLGFLQWIDLSSIYKSSYADDYYATAPIAEKHCLIYDHGKKYLVSCKEEHSAICAYTKLPKDSNLLCNKDENCFQSDYSLDSPCFCRETTIKPELKKAEFLQPYQNFLYRGQDKCVFGLEKSSEGQYIWKYNQTEVEYTNWAPKAACDGKYGVITVDGWDLTENEEKESCFLYEKPINREEPKLNLVSDGGKLKITATQTKNLKWLVPKENILLYCFTDATTYSLIYRYDKLGDSPVELSDNTVTYEFEPCSSNPGNYWCESVSLPDMNVITSNVYLFGAEKITFEFVAIIKYQYITNTNPLRGKIAEFLERVLFIKLSENEDFEKNYKLRMMKITDLDEDNNFVTVNVHFTRITDGSDQNHDEEYNKLKYILEETIKSLNNPPMNLILNSFKNVDVCFAETTFLDGVTLNWPPTKRGDIVEPAEYCFQNDATIIRRKCDGNFVDGAYWEDITSSCEIPTISSVTDNILDLFSENETSVIIDKILDISQQYSVMQPIDVYLISKLFEIIQEDPKIDLEKFSKIIDNLHEIDQTILENSQVNMKATDKLLHVIDKIIFNNQKDDALYETPNFSILTSNFKKNISGVLVENIDGDIKISRLFNRIKIEKLINNSHFECALIFSDKLILQEKYTKLAITLFWTNSLFNQDHSNFDNISRIFGVQLEDSKDFDGPLWILHRTNNEYEHNTGENCVYWNYGKDIQGSWKTDSEAIKNFSQVSLCEYWHVTHFALLVIDDINRNSDKEINILNMITFVNSVLSLAGLTGILLTAAFFKRWRQNTGNQVLINFVLAITVQIVILYVSGEIFDESKDDIICTVVGIILHYVLISEFCWMLIIAILQFRRFVEVLGGTPKYILLKACLCGWVLPLVPVGCVFGLDRKNYVSGHVGLCYPSGLGLYLGVWLPIAIIVAINLVIYIYIIYNVVHKKTEHVHVTNTDKLFQWRLAILLFFMLGITWSFGLLSELDFGNIFEYLFCFTATLQGFVMFLFFIIFNKNTRRLYCHSIKTIFVSQKYY